MNRKQRDQNRANAEHLRELFGKKSICPNCGRPGSHFAPPFLGEPGFFICGQLAAKGETK